MLDELRLRFGSFSLPRKINDIGDDLQKMSAILLLLADETLSNNVWWSSRSPRPIPRL